MWQLVAAERRGILATVNPDGSPQLSNVYYLCDHSTRLVRLSTTTTRTKGRNLLRDPRAALHVSGRDFLHFAVLAGRVSLGIPARADDAVIEELFDLHSALGATSAAEPERFGEMMLADHRMVVRLDARRIYGQVLDR